MARPLRIEFKGALYHIISRGNERRNIFLGDNDYEVFLDVLEEMSDRFDVDIFAYVLMSNHYHLLIRTNQKNLSQSMQWVGTTYTRRFNLKHSRSGHLFQGRFKSILVQNDAYLMQLSCYIHRNPLRAGLVNRLTDYRWSSYRSYAYKSSYIRWLNTDLILSQFKGKDSYKAYREKVQKYSEEDAKIFENLRHGIVFGTKNYLKKITEKHLKKKSDEELPQLNRVLKDKDPAKLLKRAAKAINFDLKKLGQSNRIFQKDVQDRDVLLYFLRGTGLYTNKQIGELFGLTYSAVSRRASIVKSKISKPSEMKRKYSLIKSIIKV
ncbi:MAG: transposase [Desulfobacterales bacterium]|jgi:REP element-mobilizing transposase RayT